MYKTVFIALYTFTLFAKPVTLQNGTSFIFATVEQGQKVLGANDDYIQEMSPFDRSARLKTDKPASTSAYLNELKKSVLTWTPKETERMSRLLKKSKTALDRYSLKLPKSILIIKTSGKSEAEAPYTRANGIIFPVSELKSPDSRIEELIYHELFHILTRYNPKLRDEFYNVIGFTKPVKIDFPAKLAKQKITNPDAIKNQHCILVNYGIDFYWAMPIIYSRAKTYDIAKKGSLFSYLELKMLLVHKADKSGKIIEHYDKQKPRIVDIRHVSNFFNQIGFNTHYIIHPEEVLADNFGYLCLEKKVRSKHVTDGIKAVLLKNNKELVKKTDRKMIE